MFQLISHDSLLMGQNVRFANYAQKLLNLLPKILHRSNCFRLTKKCSLPRKNSRCTCTNSRFIELPAYLTTCYIPSLFRLFSSSVLPSRQWTWPSTPKMSRSLRLSPQTFSANNKTTNYKCVECYLTSFRGHAFQNFNLFIISILLFKLNFIPA